MTGSAGDPRATQPPGAPEVPPLASAGGVEALRAMLADFYEHVFSDAMIGFFFRGKDRQRLVEKELELTLRALGVDVPYTGRSMPDAHRAHHIMGGQFNRRRVLLAEAMDRASLPADVQEAILRHTDALRAQVTRDARGECRPPGV